MVVTVVSDSRQMEQRTDDGMADLQVGDKSRTLVITNNARQLL